jgi:hypothetical protein
MSGGTARTCRWSKAWPGNRVAKQVLMFSQETIEIGFGGSLKEIAT